MPEHLNNTHGHDFLPSDIEGEKNALLKLINRTIEAIQKPSTDNETREKLLSSLREQIKTQLGTGYYTRDTIREIKNQIQEKTKNQNIKLAEEIGQMFPADQTTETSAEKSLDDEDINLEIIRVDNVLVPPSELKPISNKGNGEVWKKPELKPRLEELMKILGDEISKAVYILKEGIVTPDMVRQTSYLALTLPNLEKIILVCNETGNATFVIHRLAEGDKFYYSLNKIRGLNNLVDAGVTTKIIWDEDVEKWKEKILEAITITPTDDINALQRVDIENIVNETNPVISLEALQRNRRLAVSVWEEIIKEKLDSKKSLKFENGEQKYAKITISALYANLSRRLKISYNQVKSYLQTLAENPNKAEEILRLSQQEYANKKTKRPISLEELQTNEELAVLVWKNIKEEDVYSPKDLVIENGEQKYTKLNIRSLYGGLHEKLQISYNQVKSYLQTLAENPNKAEEILRLSQQEYANKKTKRSISVEELQTNKELAALVWKNIKEEPTNSPKDLVIENSEQKYTKLNIRSLYGRLHEKLQISYSQTRSYLETLANKPDEAEAKLKLLQQEYANNKKKNI